MHPCLRRGVWIWGLLVTPLGCGSEESAETADTGPVEGPCADYAQARCEVMSRCASALFAYEYGEVASCEQRLSAWCVHVGGLPSVRVGPKAIGSCAATLSGMSCETWQSRRDDPLCSAPGGSLAAGKGCVSGYQCASKACYLDADGVCGTCQPSPEEGEACRETTECPTGTTCVGYKCVRAVGVGEACDAQRPCAGTLMCVGGSCALSPNEGEPCLEGICNNKLATTCEGGVCVGLTLAGDGEACGGSVYCSGNGTCLSQGTCKAPVPEGRPCDRSAGPFCLEPAVCIDSFCKVPDPAACP